MRVLVSIGINDEIVIDGERFRVIAVGCREQDPLKEDPNRPNKDLVLTLGPVGHLGPAVELELPDGAVVTDDKSLLALFAAYFGEE